MTAEEINSIATGIATGGTSDQISPGGGPSNTPAAAGVNNPTATADPGPGTGAPTEMPKQERDLHTELLADTYSAHRMIREARSKLEASETLLFGVTAQLSFIQKSPPDRKLRADQLPFFMFLWELIDQAKARAATLADDDEQLISMLNQVGLIARRIQQL